jgi:hypothetical protein
MQPVPYRLEDFGGDVSKSPVLADGAMKVLYSLVAVAAFVFVSMLLLTSLHLTTLHP